MRLAGPSFIAATGYSILSNQVSSYRTECAIYLLVSVYQIKAHSDDATSSSGKNLWV